MDAQRELLDTLMGKGRNRSKEDAPLKQQHWNDADICPYFVCAFCPHDLFINTKSDLGPCQYLHVDELKDEYNKQPRKVKRRMEKKLLSYLYELVSDVDRRIRRGKERIALAAPSTQPNPILEQQIEHKKKSIELRCDQIDAEINKLKEHIEGLCDEGKIDDAESMLKQVEQLEADKEKLQQMDVNHLAGVAKDPQRSDKNRFEICEICGVFQALDDAEDRIARHFDGKQHKGFDVIRDKIKELETMHRDEMNDMQQRDQCERDRRGGGGAYHRDRRYQRDRSRQNPTRQRRNDRDRDRDRDGHSRSSQRRNGPSSSTSSSSRHGGRSSRDGDKDVKSRSRSRSGGSGDRGKLHKNEKRSSPRKSKSKSTSPPKTNGDSHVDKETKKLID